MRFRFIGDPFSNSGYSARHRDLIWALLRQGQNIVIHYIQQDQIQIQSSRLMALTDLVGKDNGAEVNVFVMIPEAFGKIGKYNIGLCVFETDMLPTGWAERCNTMDAIIVSSQSNIGTFKKAGVTVPIFALPEIVDLSVFRPGVQPLDIGLGPEVYKFLSVFQWSYRKGWDALLTSYWTEFKAGDPVTLILKISPTTPDPREKENIKKSIQTLKMALGYMGQDGRILKQLPEVKLIFGLWDESRLASLYSLADCFVLPTRGEGWNRPAAEASAVGIPVITTNWGGHLDYLTSTNSRLINYMMTPCMNMFNPRYTADMNWAEPDILDLKKKMREAFEDKEPKTAIANIKSMCGDMEVSKKFIEIVKQVTGKGEEQ